MVIKNNRDGQVARPIDWKAVQTRLTTRGPDSRFLPVTTGQETEAELRELAIRFTQECPNQQQRPGCPFRTLQKLYHVSAKVLISSMTRSALLSLFDLECEIRNGDQAEVAATPAPARLMSDQSVERLRKRLLSPPEA